MTKQQKNSERAVNPSALPNRTASSEDGGNQRSVDADAHNKSNDARIDISTADDVNVDEDNAIGSPKNSLTAEPDTSKNAGSD